MFKPVTGAQLEEFDEETRELFQKRSSSVALTAQLATTKRLERNHLPVIVCDPSSNEHLVKIENENKGFLLKYFGMVTFFTMACGQYMKAYYPYGIIVRRSMNVSPMQKAL